MAKWKAIGVVIEGQDISIDGVSVNPWGPDWHKVGDVMLPHPAYPNQQHEMSVYRGQRDGKTITFAVGELSAGVYGFYVPVL